MMMRACRASKTGFYMVIPGSSQSATNLYLVSCVTSTNSSFALEAVKTQYGGFNLEIKFSSVETLHVLI